MVGRRLESVLVGDVVHAVTDTIISNVLVEALGTEHLVVASTVLDAARFGHLDVVLVQEPVEIAVLVQLTGLLLDSNLVTRGSRAASESLGRGNRGEHLSWSWDHLNGGTTSETVAGTGAGAGSRSETVTRARSWNRGLGLDEVEISDHSLLT